MGGAPLFRKCEAGVAKELVLGPLKFHNWVQAPTVPTLINSRRLDGFHSVCENVEICSGEHSGESMVPIRWISSLKKATESEEFLHRFQLFR